LAVYAVRISNIRSALADRDTVAVLNSSVLACSVAPDAVPTNEIVAAWREAYAVMGVKPSKFRSSIEALLRRAVKRADISLPIPAVNIYNAVSIDCLSPMGAYDVSRMPKGHLALRLANPATDHFNPLGADSSAFPLTSNLVVYAIGDEVMCWGVNSRDSRVAALTESTDEAIFFSEAVRTAHRSSAERAVRSLSTAMASYGATCAELKCANRLQPEIAI
jgi:lysyl-tRNA synthetase class 2